MIDGLKYGMSVLLLVIAMIIFPATRFAEYLDYRAHMRADAIVYDFSDLVKSKGFITPKDYREFTEKLSSTGLGYTLEMENRKKIQVPLYNGVTFANKFMVDYEGYFTKDIVTTLYPQDSTLSDSNEARYWKMKSDDMFYVRAYFNNNSFSNALRGSFGLSRIELSPSEHGGAVRNEAP